MFLISFILSLASPPLFAAGTAPELQTQKDKAGYSIGYEVGRSLKADGVEANFDRIVQGLEDSINGREPRLKDEEMRKLIVDLRKKSREAQYKNFQEMIAKNAQESDKFLEENSKKDGVKVTGSGLQYRVLKEGGGNAPGPEDYVKVHYRGTFVDSTEFDSSYAKGQPIKVHTDSVIKGWAEALPMMKTGSRWQLFVPPELAYGKRGFGQRIPPNKALIFDLELLAVEKAEKADQLRQAQTDQAHPAMKLSTMGEIAKSKYGYIIRTRKGNAPGEILTVVNPNPKVLDEFVKSEKIVPIEVRIVSGDNVNIERIDGREYREGTP